MKQKVIFLKWLPASGKSTYAKEICWTNSNFIRVNKDDIRAMMGGEFSKPKEQVVLDTRDRVILSSLNAGFWVVVDDTNLEPKHEDRVRQLIMSSMFSHVQMEVKLFDVPLSECLKRNRKRDISVPDNVIKEMAEKYGLWKEPPEFEKVVQNPNLLKAIIVDIDWTIANKNNRFAYDYTTVSEDMPYEDIISLVGILSDKYSIIFVSWRSDSCRADTEEWIGRYLGGSGWTLKMRKEWDQRKDSIIKYEILQEIIKSYYVEYVLDDRNKVVKMFREAGLRVLQVADWNF